MQNKLDRRAFLTHGTQTCLLLSGIASATKSFISAVEPFQRAGNPRLLLSLAAYSFRDYFNDRNPSRTQTSDKERRIDLFQFIDFCADHGCEGTELTSYYFPQNPAAEFLLSLKRHAFLRGIAISGTAVGNTFTLDPGEKRNEQIAMVKTWIDRAQILGAPHIRVFAGTASGISASEAKKRSIAGLEECADYAGTKGIFLGLENHGGIVAEADEVLEIVRAVKSTWLGVNLDTGNFRTNDPYGDIAKCAPFAVNVQLKSEITPKGGSKTQADLPRLVRILRAANYQGYVALEYEASDTPWTAVPPLLAKMKKAFAA